MPARPSLSCVSQGGHFRVLLVLVGECFCFSYATHSSITRRDHENDPIYAHFAQKNVPVFSKKPRCDRGSIIECLEGQRIFRTHKNTPPLFPTLWSFDAYRLEWNVFILSIIRGLCSLYRRSFGVAVRRGFGRFCRQLRRGLACSSRLFCRR